MNSITILIKKREHLVAYKTQLKHDYEQQIAEVDANIGQIDTALSVIDKAAEPYRCKACGGSGYCYGTDAAGGREERRCEKCKGTGFCG